MTSRRVPGSSALCWRCKVQTITICYMSNARTSAEFLGMCDGCYEAWLSQFPAAPPPREA